MRRVTRTCLGSVLLVVSFVLGNLAYVAGGNAWTERQETAAVGMVPSQTIMGVTLYGWHLYGTIAGLGLVALCLAAFGVCMFFWRPRYAGYYMHWTRR